MNSTQIIVPKDAEYKMGCTHAVLAPCLPAQPSGSHHMLPGGGQQQIVHILWGK